MDDAPLREALAQALELGSAAEVLSMHPVSGGCIHDSYAVSLQGGVRVFVKTNHSTMLEVFETEAAGLRELAVAQAVRVPEVRALGQAGQRAFLALEHLELGGSANAVALGKALAQLHQHTGSAFGWVQDNHIGSTPQLNTPQSEDWVDFFTHKRLRYQLDLAAQKGRRFEGVEALLDNVGVFFKDYTPVPSLIHGDLWSGNVGYLADGTPVLFDPAVYYADRECDLAFTEMFGGFGGGFYSAYAEAYPLDKGYAQRKDLYNLYHWLNHFNLFGGSYASSAEGVIQRLLTYV